MSAAKEIDVEAWKRNRASAAFTKLPRAYRIQGGEEDPSPASGRGERKRASGPRVRLA